MKEAIEAIEPGEITLPRDNPVLDFLKSANEKFKEGGIFLILQGNTRPFFLYHQSRAHIHISSGAKTSSSTKPTDCCGFSSSNSFPFFF